VPPPAAHALLCPQVTAVSGYLYKFSKDERRVKLQEALTQFAPPRFVLITPSALHN